MKSLFEEEAPKSERLFSQLTTAWYNWAVAEMLNEKGVHCWALTAAYYSMVHAARTPMSLTNNYRCGFVRSHSDFPRFLNGAKYTSERDQSINELSTALKISPDSINNLFRQLHNVLSAFKEAREMTSYEKYIIAHQLREDIEASSWLTKICKIAYAYVESTNKKVSELTYDYVRLHRLSAYYVHHLREEIVQFKELLEKEHLAMPKKLELIVNRFGDLITHVSEPTDMDHFMENTRGYRSKDESYERLHSILSRVLELDGLSANANS